MIFSSSIILGLFPIISSLFSVGFTHAELTSNLSSSGKTQQRSACQTTHTFLARGYNENYPGRQQLLVNAICSGVGSDECGYEDIIFDDMEGSVYGMAVREGVMAGKSQVTAYANDCPDANLVLSGYSLGAHVVGDMLGGNGGDFTMYGTVEPEVDGFDSATTSPGSHLAAVLLFGDTRHTAGQPYNVGSGAGKNSYYPRTGEVLDRMGAYGSVLRSYCVSTDPVCAQGDDVSTHLDYFQRSTDDAARWVRLMVGMENATTAATATETVASSSQAASETTSAALTTTIGASEGAGSVTSTSSGFPTSAETDASTTWASSATGSAAATATTVNGVVRPSCNKGLTWTFVVVGLCLLVGQ